MPVTAKLDSPRDLYIACSERLGDTQRNEPLRGYKALHSSLAVARTRTDFQGATRESEFQDRSRCACEETRAQSAS